MCNLRATVGWKHTTDAAFWLKPLIAPAAIILLFKTNSGFTNSTLYKNACSSNNTPPEGDKTEALRWHDLISQPERCSPSGDTIDQFGWTQRRIFHRCFAADICVSCLAEKWHHVCWEPVRWLDSRPCSFGALWSLLINSSSTSWQMKEPAWSVWRSRCCPSRDYPGEESACLKKDVRVSLGLNLNTTHKSKGHLICSLECRATGTWSGSKHAEVIAKTIWWMKS